MPGIFSCRRCQCRLPLMNRCTYAHITAARRLIFTQSSKMSPHAHGNSKSFLARYLIWYLFTVFIIKRSRRANGHLSLANTDTTRRTLLTGMPSNIYATHSTPRIEYSPSCIAESVAARQRAATRRSLYMPGRLPLKLIDSCFILRRADEKESPATPARCLGAKLRFRLCFMLNLR